VTECCGKLVSSPVSYSVDVLGSNLRPQTSCSDGVSFFVYLNTKTLLQGMQLGFLPHLFFDAVKSQVFLSVAK
jgi:hypothetical protein